MSDTKNKDFNIKQITDVLAELASGSNVIGELIDNMGQYEDLLATTKAELNNIGSVTKEIQIKINKNVKFVMNQIDSIMNSSILLRKISTKKVDLLVRLARGIKYSYKLNNDIHVMGPEALKFDSVTSDVANNILTVGGKTFQFSTKDDYDNDRSDISDIYLQYSDDEDEEPDLDFDSITADDIVDDLKCINDPLSKYNGIVEKLVNTLNLANKLFNTHFEEEDDLFDTYFSNIVNKVVVLVEEIKDEPPSVISQSIFRLDAAVKDSKRDFEINHDYEDCEKICPIHDALDYYLDKTQKILQTILSSDAAGNTDNEYNHYMSVMDDEIQKARSAQTLLEISQSSIDYIKETIEEDVKHFNLFDSKILKDIYASH
jgi:hypothetical protein